MKFHIFPLATALLALSACSDSAGLPGDTADSPREMNVTFAHPSAGSRVTDTSFESGDCVGLYVLNTGDELMAAGSMLSNVPLTFNGTAWTNPTPLYWNSTPAGEVTPWTYDFYAYFPYQKSIASVTDHPFMVKLDQTRPAEGQSGYELSDFLWGSRLALPASNDPVNIQFRHLMSRLTIRLIKGDDYEGEIPEDVKVYVHNTVPNAFIDLEYGFATVDGHSSAATIQARKESTEVFSAIIVPQRLDTRVPLIEVISEGVSYMYDTKFLFKSGINHLVNLVIDKNPDQLKIEIGGEITDWASTPL